MNEYLIRVHFGDTDDDDGEMTFIYERVHAMNSDAAIELISRLYPQANRYEVME